MAENTLYGELREWHGPRKCNKCGTVRTFTFVVPHSLGSEPTIMPRETCDGEWLPYDRRKPHERRKGDRRAHPAPKGDMVDDLIDRLREETCSEDDGGVPFYDASLADDIIREYFANFLALVGAGGLRNCTKCGKSLPPEVLLCDDCILTPEQDAALRRVFDEEKEKLRAEGRDAALRASPPQETELREAFIAGVNWHEAEELRQDHVTHGYPEETNRAVDEYALPSAASAPVCLMCNGTGEITIYETGGMAIGIAPCPAGCKSAASPPQETGLREALEDVRKTLHAIMQNPMGIPKIAVSGAIDVIDAALTHPAPQKGETP